MKKIRTFIISSLAIFTLATGGGYLGYSLASDSSNTAVTEIPITQTTTVVTESSIVDVVETAWDSVVEISTETVYSSRRGSYTAAGAGSGVIISDDGYIVTNNHVIEGVSSIFVTTTDGTEYEAELIMTDEENDVALLKIEATDLTYALFGDSDQLQVGELAVAIGNPLGSLGGTVTEGIISATDREITIDGVTMTLLQTSAAINQGNSGGGLFNANGELIGIVNAKSSGLAIEGLGFAIPINAVKEIISEIVSVQTKNTA